MNESYTIVIKIDDDYKNGDLVVLEKDRNGELRLVNTLYDIDTIADIYEQLIGRNI